MALDNNGDTVSIQGSGKKPYTLKNTGGVLSCDCPAWRNQNSPIERRTCKHLKKIRGVEAESVRIDSVIAPLPSEVEVKPIPALLLAESWDNKQDVTGWWISEKLDGVRAYWDGKQFISREGNVYLAPDWFTAGLPSTPLDGELWMDRKSFQKTISIVRRQDKPDTWDQIRYLVFDAPTLEMQFEDRVEWIKDTVNRIMSKYIEAVSQERCQSNEHLKEELSRIEALGGEGLMIRQPNSKYEANRSNTLLKIKTFYDAEAVVICHLPGKGKHKGRLGALHVRMENGNEFSIGTGFSDAERENPPAIGSVVTYRYQELTDGGIPRFPSYVRIRD